jgi:hypothetical protein
MRFELNASDGQEVLPTFFQFCKATLDQKTPDRFIVTKIWLPNKYPDLTLETEKFRLRISHKADVFSTIRDSVNQFVNDNMVLAVSEILKTSYDYTLEVLEGEVGDWTMLGDFGWSCEVQNKPSGKKRKTRT